MFTRQQYLDHICTHEQYYGQFVTRGTRSVVANYIGLDRIRASQWPFNDIPLHKWDKLAHILPFNRAAYNLANPGQTLDLALSGVCIAKEAARQLSLYTPPEPSYVG